MDFWRRSARISRKNKIRNTIIKQKMKVTRSLLEDIKAKQLQCYDMIYLLTAIGLSPGGSRHLHTNNT